MQALEDRLAERIAQQLQTAVTARTERLITERLQAEQRATPAPVATPLLPAGDKSQVSAAFPAPPPARSAWRTAPKANGEASATLVIGSVVAGVMRLLVDVCREFLAIFWMFMDRHYHVSWSTRLLTLILLAAFLTSSWWNLLAYFPPQWLIGFILAKLVDLLLAFAMFRVLSREAHQYLEARKSAP
jgi:hypothetical protein